MLFSTTLSQMAFLFSFIALGYLLTRLRAVPDNAAGVLSKLENYVFLPALVLETFMGSFTLQTLTDAQGMLLWSLAVEIVVLAVSLVCVRLCARDRYTQNIFMYGLCFSNFGFMGNAVVQALFPDTFFEYLIFTLVLWTFIYVWGVPQLLMGDAGAKPSGLARLKNFYNPMFICMAVGMLIGVTGLPVPKFAGNLVASAADCMSPVAMLLTGMTIAKASLPRLLRMKMVYAVSFLRLIAYPLVFLGLHRLIGFPISDSLLICTVASLAMPLGLNTIVIPSAYGKDTTAASAMALISHVLAVGTIPIVFALMETMIG